MFWLSHFILLHYKAFQAMHFIQGSYLCTLNNRQDATGHDIHNRQIKARNQIVWEVQLVASNGSNVLNLIHLQEGEKSSHLMILALRNYGRAFHQQTMVQSTIDGTLCVFPFLHGAYPTSGLGHPHQSSFSLQTSYQTSTLHGFDVRPIILWTCAFLPQV